MSTQVKRFAGAVAGFAFAAVWAGAGFSAALFSAVAAALGFAAVVATEGSARASVTASLAAWRSRLETRRVPAPKPARRRPRPTEPPSAEDALAPSGYGW